jgi:glutamine amidotransferase
MTIGLVDVGTGNLAKFKNIFNEANTDFKIVRTHTDILNCDKLIFPGVGSMSLTMEYLRNTKLDKAITEHILKQKNYWGICLGMQILFDQGIEGKETVGLGILKGNVEELPTKLTNSGFNYSIDHLNFDSKLYYFNHKYFCHVSPKQNYDFLSYSTVNGFQFVSKMVIKNIMVTQFHPEQSGEMGKNELITWIKLK